jgi:hypothetical protein
MIKQRTIIWMTHAMHIEEVKNANRIFVEISERKILHDIFRRTVKLCAICKVRDMHIVMDF